MCIPVHTFKEEYAILENTCGNLFIKTYLVLNHKEQLSISKCRDHQAACSVYNAVKPGINEKKNGKKKLTAWDFTVILVKDEIFKKV